MIRPLLLALAAIATPASAQTAEHLIASLHLAPIPQEGAWFAQVWKSPQTVPGTQRPIGTAIVVLETRAGFSAFHKLRTDEIWHYSAGDPLRLVLMAADCRVRVLRLDATHPMAVVPGDMWQASRPDGPKGWFLGGTSMAPGFDPAEFTLGKRADLRASCPAQAGLVDALTRQEGGR